MSQRFLNRAARPLAATPNRADPESRSTSARLLEAAGEIFAEKGFERTTGKEICAKAAANTAAINYYFGSVDGLYAAVLEEAQERFITFDAISKAVAPQTAAAAKLKALSMLAAERLTAPVSRSWVFRVLAREMAAPSPAFQAIRARELPPRARLIRAIVAEIVDLPPDHPAVARGAISIIAPFAMLSIADRRMIARAFPSLALDESGAQALGEHLYRYAMAGLADIRRRAHARR
jgi:TetR/AcrR family transcriptional regulator, regulator of cefoperazone and chloramphenicol sensitivity